MNLLYYLAEANLYLGVFYLAYCLLLTKETHYQLNRAYLLFSCMAAFILPVLQIGALKPVEAVVNTTVNYVVPEYTEPLSPNDAVNVEPAIVEHHLGLQDYLLYVYVLGACVLFILLMIKLYNLFKLMRDAQTIDQLKYKVVYLPDSGVAFSFFNYLFIGNNAPGANTIIRHELVHIRQKHSFDIVFLELLKVVSWFNPFVYLLQNSLKTVHEYIADEQTAAHESDALTYSTFLVNNAYGSGGSSITHSFFNYNLLKKRIIMLHQQRSGSLARLKYLVTLPICAGLLCTSTLAFSKTYGWVDLDPAKPAGSEYNIPLPNIAHEDIHKGIVINISKENSVVGFNDPKTNTAKPLLVANGKLYHLNKLKPGTSIIINADSTTQYNPDNEYALATWGKDAENGVLVLHGNNASVKISDTNLPETLHLNFPQPGSVNLKLPAKSGTTHKNKHGGNVTVGRLTNAMLPITAMVKADPGLLFIVNGKKHSFDIANLKEKELIAISYDSITVYEKGNAYARSKWGNDVGKVAILHGNAALKLVDWSKSDKTAATKSFDAPPDFAEYLWRNIHYTTADRNNNISGKVITLFAINDDNTIKYIQVVKSPSDAMSAEVLRVLKKTPYLNTLKSGIQYTLPVSFTIGISDPAPGEVVPPSPKTVGNVITYNPNGVVMSENPQGALIFKEIIIRTFLQGSASPFKPADTIAKPDWEKFGKYFAWNVKYPRSDRENLINGRVITIFSVNADHGLQYAKVVRTPSESMAVEVLRVLKKCPEFTSLKPGVQYSIPISFTLGIENGSDYRPEIKTSPAATISDPDALIYNPNNINISFETNGLALNEVVIRGYVRK